MVAEAWSVLGLIDKEAPAQGEYLPSHFVDDIHFPFLQNAYLDPVTYVRCGVDPDSKQKTIVFFFFIIFQRFSPPTSKNCLVHWSNLGRPIPQKTTNIEKALRPWVKVTFGSLE